MNSMPNKKMTDAEKAKLKKMLMQGGNLDKLRPTKPVAPAKPSNEIIGMTRQFRKMNEMPKRPAKPLLPTKPARPDTVVTRQVGRTKPLFPKKKAR